MSKTLEEYFHDWESETFGFGYGTGEEHTLKVLKQFLELCDEGDYHHGYSYERLEKELTAPVAWLLINKLCRANIIEYGTSPRYGWLEPRGEKLRAFVVSKTDEELYQIACDREQHYVECYVNHCNCDDRPCNNPFWSRA